MSQKEMLPPRAFRRKSRAVSSAPECVCFLYRTVLLVTVNGTVEGQLNSLSAWQPGMSAPTVPYRFRFHEPVPDMTHFRRTTGGYDGFPAITGEGNPLVVGYNQRRFQALSDVVTEPVNGDNDLQRVLNEALAAFPPALPAFSSVVSMSSAPDASSSVLSGQPWRMISRHWRLLNWRKS